MPQCYSQRGTCKFFNHLPKAFLEHEGLFGNPSFYLYAGGLFNFEILSSKMINLSGLDGKGFQTVDFYPNMAGEIDMNEVEFQTLLSMKKTYITNKQIDMMKKK